MACCKLCLEDKPLLESHIIPRHLFKYNKIMPRYNKETSLVLISKTSLTHAEFDYDGEKESNFMCRGCEILIMQYEDYYVDIFQLKPIAKKYNVKVVYTEMKKDEWGMNQYSGLDFTKLKLYFISIFWRMSKSKLPMFRYFKLGDYHEEIMRKMFLHNDPLSQNVYPISKMSCINPNYPSGHLIPLNMLYLRNPIGHAWRGLIGNLGITFKVSHKGTFEVPEHMEEIFQTVKLTESGELVDVMISEKTWSHILYRDSGLGDMLETHSDYFINRKKTKLK